MRKDWLSYPRDTPTTLPGLSQVLDFGKTATPLRDKPNKESEPISPRYVGTVLKGSPLFQTESSWTLRNHGTHKSGSLSLTYHSPKVKDNLIGQLGEEEGCNGQAEEHRMQGVQRPQLL